MNPGRATPCPSCKKTGRTRQTIAPLHCPGPARGACLPSTPGISSPVVSNWFDVRSPADFSRGALPGALNIPVDSLSYDYRLLSREQPVIVYGASEFRSGRAARLLAGHGFQRIYHPGKK